MLAINGPATPADIASSLSMALAVVNMELGQLVGAGFVRASGHELSPLTTSYLIDMPQVSQEMAQVRQLLGIEVE